MRFDAGLAELDEDAAEGTIGQNGKPLVRRLLLLRETPPMASKKKKPENAPAVDDTLFWDLAEPLMANGAERSTMMGHPCLRIDGDFFASLERRTGDLIVKLPADRVDEMIGDGSAEPFAPAGRRFKEWALITDRDESRWESLLQDAIGFVGST